MPRTKPSVRTPVPHAQVPVLPARDSVVFPGMIHTLHVAREGSRRAVRLALNESRPVFVVSQRDMAVEEPAPSELHRIGTLCEALQAVPLPDGSLRIALRGLRRAEAVRYHRRGGLIQAAVENLAESDGSTLEHEALMRACVEAFTEIVERGKKIPAEALETVVHQETAGALADAIAHHLPLRPAQKQPLLEEIDAATRLQDVFSYLRREQRLLVVQSEISERVDREFANAQREFYLREQLRTIQSELEAMGDAPSEIRALEQRILEAGIPEPAQEKVLHELGRLERTSPHSAEAMVIRTYIDWMVSLPWSKQSPDRLDVKFARKVLDEAHFGLDPVKDRILDFLAVRQLSRSLRGPILCFVGPPGVGKTSVGRSIAEALGREFVRISLGGLRDEAEIRGHRRTYVGAMPGRIIQNLRACGTRNPVVVLDEIDKLASDFRGDPSSALLEALDPAQNERFSDHYLETPFDLSAVLFIATANLAEDIPHALRDRMEVVRFLSYTDEERLAIAERFVLPRQIEAHGLKSNQISVDRTALKALAQDYTREAGIRELERMIGAVCRKAARKIAQGSSTKVRVTKPALEKLIGAAPLPTSMLSLRNEVGTANALVVTYYGGETIPIEVLLLERSSSGATIRLTGNLGEVMRESAEAALSFVRSIQKSI
ncbi:MAG TPA: endopeptidase La, partial [Fimbriimonadaceae bacterium]|nr:endopeptidase La [Fimbriimonadaceae bacterium]